MIARLRYNPRFMVSAILLAAVLVFALIGPLLPGHDPFKVYAAYHAAANHKGQPTVILAKTIKGYQMGEEGEGMNTAHQIKKLSATTIKKIRDRFGMFGNPLKLVLRSDTQKGAGANRKAVRTDAKRGK